MKRFFQIANVIALIITLFFNYLSNTGVFNGNTMGSVSARYDNLFTPAGYAFSIWGLIYVGLFIFMIYQARSIFKEVKDDDFVLQIGWWFIISCAANSLWVLAWLYDYTGTSVLLMLIILFSLLKIIVNTRMELDEVPIKKLVFLWWPFSIYSGWISVALIANISAWLTKIGWDNFGLPDLTWAIILIVIAGIINLFMTWTRNMREYALVGVWALVAIAVANRDTEQAVFTAALTVGAILLISTTVHAYKNRKSLSKLFLNR